MRAATGVRKPSAVVSRSFFLMASALFVGLLSGRCCAVDCVVYLVDLVSVRVFWNGFLWAVVAFETLLAIFFPFYLDFFEMALRAVLPVDLSFGSARRPMNFDSARRAASRAMIA